MPVVIALVAVLVLAVIAGLTVWIRRTASCGRTIQAPSGELTKLYRGDVICRSGMTSGSFARLEFFDWGIRLRGVAVLGGWVVPTWEARYDELAVAELVTVRFSRIAVWLRVRGEPGGIGFLSHFSDEILGELAARDVPVNRAVAQVRSTAELYARGPQ
jgi:hypothetical protein